MLKSMKMSKKETKESMKAIEATREEYPWGLRVDLNSDSIEKLGIDIKNYKIGENVLLKCKAKVKRLSITSDDYEKDHPVEQSMDLQITHMDIVSQDSFNEAFDEASKKED